MLFIQKTCFMLLLCSLVSVVYSESAAEHVLETFDLDGDSFLNHEEFESYFYSIFPNMNTTEAHDEHAHDEHGTEETMTEEETAADEHGHAACEEAEHVFAELDTDGSELLNITQVEELVNIVMIMLIEGCGEEDAHNHAVACETVDLWLSWIYAIGTTIVICLLSLLGVVLIPLKGKTKERVMKAFLGLAIGALVGDAILHIFPQMYGAHSHEEATTTTQLTHLEEALDSYILPGVVCVFSIFLFYIIEVTTEHLTGGNHGMSALEQDSDSDEFKKKKDHGEYEHVGYMIIILDGIHNFVDGLALGTAFITSPVTGFATALAIVLHELPQELGDFAVLIWAGFSRKQALFFNLASSLTAIVGTVVGLLVGDAIHAADKWILSAVAGSFLYIGLGELLPHLAHSSKGEGSKIPQIVLMLVGMGLMVALSFVELALEVECA